MRDMCDVCAGPSTHPQTGTPPKRGPVISTVLALRLSPSAQSQTGEAKFDNAGAYPKLSPQIRLPHPRGTKPVPLRNRPDRHHQSTHHQQRADWDHRPLVRREWK